MEGVKAEGENSKLRRCAYTPEEIQAMLTKLSEPARTVLATVAVAGVRESEIRGFRWEDSSEDGLRVVRSVRRQPVSDPKIEEGGENPGLVISVRRRTIEEHWRRSRAMDTSLPG